MCKKKNFKEKQWVQKHTWGCRQHYRDMQIVRVGNRPGRPTGAYGLACLSLAWPGLFMKKVRLRLLKKPI